MTITAAIASGILLVVGAAVGFVPNYLLERKKQRHALAVRWDMPLYELCGEFASSVRQFVHLVRRYDRVDDKEAHRIRVDEEHAKVRSLAQRIRLLGSGELQQAVKEAEHHLWWVREVHEDRADAVQEYYGGRHSEARLRASLQLVLITARRQLGVSDPESVADDEPIDPRPSSRPTAVEPQ